MQTRVQWLVGVIGLVLSIAGPAGATTLFVNNASTVASENGTPLAPYKTITKAIERARVLRFGPAGVSDTIYVLVRGNATPYTGSFASTITDPSKERLPLVLNVPNLKIVGGTRLVTGADGLPSGVVPGTETTLRSEAPQEPKQYLILIARTTMAGVAMNGDDVTIVGMRLEAAPTRKLPSALIGIDGVHGFTLVGNALVNGGNGVFTRLARGLIVGNLLSSNGVGFYLTGGSQSLPARLVVTGNRIVGGAASVTGIGLLGAAETSNLRLGLELGANAPALTYLAPSETFDRALPASVPDTLDAEVVGNSISGYQLGIRCAGYLQNPYKLVEPQEESAHLNAVIAGNVSIANLNYGLVVDAAQIPLGERRSIDFTLAVEGNTFEGGTANAVLSFWRNAGSFELQVNSSIPFTFPGDVFAQPNPTFARHSTIDICGDLTQFQWDNRQDPNPATNPPPLDNHLTVNGVALDGRFPNSAAELGLPMPVVIPPAVADCVAPFSAP